MKIQAGAGLGSGFKDAAYTAAGAEVTDVENIWKSQMVAKVNPPTLDEAAKLGDRTLGLVGPSASRASSSTSHC